MVNKVILFFYLYICMILKKYYKKMQQLLGLETKKQTHTNLKKYIQKQTMLFESFCENDSINNNINEIFYNKESYNEAMKDNNNTLEPYWKSNILMDTLYRDDDVPVMTIMYYDVYKQGFCYVTDDNKLSYKSLNAMAMKYVKTFCCMDFYFDEKTLINNNRDLPTLKSIFFDEDKNDKNKRDSETKEQSYDDNNDVYVKLKPVSNNKKEKQYFKNKFIYGGKILDFQFLKKSNVKKIAKNDGNIFDKLFTDNMSYSDWKKMRTLDESS